MNFVRLITRVQRRIRAARIASQLKMKQRIEASRSATLLDFEWRKTDGDRPVGRAQRQTMVTGNGGALGRALSLEQQSTLARSAVGSSSSSSTLAAPSNGSGRPSPNGTPYISPSQSPRPPTRALSTPTPASGGVSPANDGSPGLGPTSIAPHHQRRTRHLTLLMTAEDQTQLSRNLRFMRLLVRLQRAVRGKHLAAQQRLKQKLEAERERNMAEFERKLAMIKMEGITGVTSRAHRRVHSFHPSAFTSPPSTSIVPPGGHVTGLLPVGSVTPGPSYTISSSSSASGSHHTRSATMALGQGLPAIHATPAWTTPSPSGISINVGPTFGDHATVVPPPIAISMTPNPSMMSRAHHFPTPPSSSSSVTASSFVPSTPQPWSMATAMTAAATGAASATMASNAGRRFPKPVPPPIITTPTPPSTSSTSSSTSSMRATGGTQRHV
jgi:hypothetical protein